MKNDAPSPEEKLFKIIQQGAGPAAAGKLPRKKNIVIAWKEKTAWLIKYLAEKAGAILPEKLEELKLKNVNLGLFGLLLFLILVAACYAVVKYPSIAKIVSAASKTQASLPQVYTDIEQLQPVNFYTDAVRQRNIFGGGQRQVEASRGPEEALAAKGPSAELKLQGIVWSDVPKVILQIERDDKTYVVKEGQEVDSTGIKVKMILRNKVIFSQGDKEFEI